MRLIDGDELIELINGGYDLDFDEVPETKRELLRMIMEQPTVDAVPVDFIRSEIERIKKGSNRYYSECEAYADDLDILLMEWERRK